VAKTTKEKSYRRGVPGKKTLQGPELRDYPQKGRGKFRKLGGNTTADKNSQSLVIFIQGKEDTSLRPTSRTGVERGKNPLGGRGVQELEFCPEMLRVKVS